MRITEYDIHEWLAEAVKARADIDSSVIHVSEVVGCLRRAYYARRRFFTITPYEAIVLLGSQIHQAIESILQEHGFETEFEVAVNREGIRLLGHIDAYHPQENVVLEFKTVKAVPETPYKSHKLQAETYGAMVEADKVYIVYISRTDGKVKVFNVKWSPSTLDFLFDRAKLLSNCLSNNKTPPRERSHLCNYCPFKLNCLPYREYKGEKQRKPGYRRGGGARGYGGGRQFKRYRR
ncbi:MAG: CRISPR-associated protein Cas4 [Candidatus Hydrothermarchaeota archaeon]|nr:MAG: CRISPR-associated protein Cas4 [Candidatus Hydrothermarchaeota archaeon]